MDEPFLSFNAFLKARFPGGRVQKIPIDAGFSCPNRDGTLSRAGCIFCDRYASGPVATAAWPIERQIDAHIRRHPGKKFIAYFQSNCNTYGAIPELRRKYETVFNYEEIVGLFIGTRPDALPGPVLSLLQEMNRRIYLSVELGLQSVHTQSLALLNRNHTYEQFAEAFGELRSRSIDVIVHLIIGIPGETLAHMRATVAAMNALRPAGVKFHLLHVLKDTELELRHVRSPLPLLSREEYTDIICDLLQRLDPAIVVHRLAADREKELFIAPLWAQNKAAVLQAIQKKMLLRGAYQGQLHDGSRPLAAH
jgi:radical SAM protein (TIGR01212 family)